MDKIQILKSSTISGNVLTLPNVRLDRKVYLELAASLEIVGGKWTGGKTQGFVFEQDPTELVQKLIEILPTYTNIKKEFQFFATPNHTAEYLVSVADLPDGEFKILEPSAGQGAIVKAIQKQTDNIVDCFELLPLNQIFLNRIENINILGNDFLQSVADSSYDFIIANPPFNKGQDLQHVLKMYDHLKVGGRMVTVMSIGWQHSTNKKQKDFQTWLSVKDYTIDVLQRGTFATSGTDVETCILILDKN